MGKNLVVETFDAPGDWVCPAGVTKVVCCVYDSQPSVMAGGDTSFIMSPTANTVQGFGSSASGQIGNNSIANTSNPVGISAFTNSPTRIFSAGVSHVLALVDMNHFLFMWGSNLSGELGDSTVVPKSSPINLTALNSTSLRFKTFSAGDRFSLGIAWDGQVYSWGLGSSGQLGSNGVASRSSPDVVVGGLKFKRIAAGGAHCLGLSTTNLLYAWGSNASGQLGDGTTVSKSSPVLVGGGHTFVSISAGTNNSYAVKADGSGYAWGANATGAIGDGTAVAKSTPVLISGGLQWRSINGSMGGEFAIGITRTGVGYGWGTNNSGQVGDGTSGFNTKSSPIAITGGLLFSEVACGSTHVISLDSKGRFMTWGGNGGGQLGDGTSVGKSSPVMVARNIAATNVLYFGGYPNRRLQNRVVIDVVPGLTYSVDTLGFICSFGGQDIGPGLGDKLTVELEYYT